MSLVTTAAAIAATPPTLRVLQRRAYAEMRKAYARGVRRLLVCAPTGFGKTILIAFVVVQHIARGGRVLIVVHRRELVRQTWAKLRAAGLDESAPVVVETVQSLLARGSLPPATLVVLDEAHHYVADEWKQLAAAYPEAILLGFTATPERADGAPLGDAFDDMIVAATVPELIELGDLCPCDVIAPPRPTSALAWDPLAAWLEHADRRPTISFHSGVKEARDQAASFRAIGVAAAHVDGEMPEGERDAVIEAFCRGDLTVLTNVFCLTEGFDAPRTAVVMLARGCSSTGSYLQMIGRALRPSPGKDAALLIDLRGAVHRHGLPDEARTFSLDGRAISGGGEAPVKTCASCNHACAIACRTCPTCGASFDATTCVVDRCELVKIGRAEQERGFFVDCLETAQMRGFKPGWVAHRFKEKFGRFPAKLWREFVAGKAAA